jgi:phosphate transport system substrate-binding protein
LLLTVVAGCSSRAAATRHLVVSGSRDMAPLLEDIGQRFRAEHPLDRIDVQASTSNAGVSNTRDGLADVGMAARPLRAEEVYLQVVPIARDGMALLVHRGNPVKTLSEQQVAALWTRVLTNWKQVGGPDRPVALVGQPEERAAREVFVEHFGIKTSNLRPDQTGGGSAGAVRAVAGLANGLGYASLAAAERGIAEGLPVRVVALNGVTPTQATIANGTYPLTRPLNMLTRRTSDGLAGEFIAFAHSAAVHDLIRKQGYVPAKP